MVGDLASSCGIGCSRLRLPGPAWPPKKGGGVVVGREWSGDCVGLWPQGTHGLGLTGRMDGISLGRGGKDVVEGRGSDWWIGGD